MKEKPVAKKRGVKKVVTKKEPVKRKKKEATRIEFCGHHLLPLARLEADDGCTIVWCTYPGHGFYRKIESLYGT